MKINLVQAISGTVAFGTVLILFKGGYIKIKSWTVRAINRSWKLWIKNSYRSNDYTNQKMVTQQKVRYTNVSLWVENDSIHSETLWTVLDM